MAKKMTKNTCVIMEGVDSDEGDENDIQFVPSARTVTRFGRSAGSWFNLIDQDTGSE